MKHACLFCCLTLSEKKHLWENFVNSSKPIEVPKTSQLLKIPKTSCAMKLPWLLWLFLASASADCVGRDQPTATMPRQLSVNGTASDSNGVHHAHHNLALESMLPISCWLGDWLTQQALAVFFKQQFCDVCPQETIHVGKFHLLFLKLLFPSLSQKTGSWFLFCLFSIHLSPPKKTWHHPLIHQTCPAAGLAHSYISTAGCALILAFVLSSSMEAFHITFFPVPQRVFFLLKMRNGWTFGVFIYTIDTSVCSSSSSSSSSSSNVT